MNQLKLVLLTIRVLKSISLFDNCEENNGINCLKCKNHFTMIDGQCPCYDRNCQSCSSSYFGGCQKCQEGFFLEHKTKTCRCKIDNCLYCNNYGCDKCEIGYKLEDNQCVKDTTFKCENENCLLCNSDKKGSCIKCKNNYELINGTCENPINCEIFNDICYFCKDGYFPFGDSCILNCLGADIENNNCLSCSKNLFLQETLNCEGNCTNISNCSQCRKNEPGYCDRCAIGYGLFEGNCQKCNVNNCIKCDSDNNICDSCIYGFYIDKDKKCQEYNTTCVDNCSKCSNDDESECFLCESGYEYSYDSKSCIKTNGTNCLIRKDGDCLVCNSSYVLNNNSCISTNFPDFEHCLDIDNNQCIKCESGLILEDEHCNLYNINQSLTYNTAICSNNKCNIFCNENQFLDSISYKCQNCSEHCLSCYSESICKECEPNYSGYLGICKEIGFDPENTNCIKNDEFGKCLECKSWCNLTDDNKCKCSYSIIIVVSIVVVIVAIILGILIIFYFRKKRQVIALHRAREEKKIRLELEIKNIEKSKLTLNEIEEVLQNDLKLPKCFKCLEEIPYFQFLTCGCYLCSEDYDKAIEKNKRIEKEKEERKKQKEENKKGEEKKKEDKVDENKTINEDISQNEFTILDKRTCTTTTAPEKKTIIPGDIKIIIKNCPICGKEILSIKQVSSRCQVCFKFSTKLFKFKCGCKIEVCCTCFNLLIDKKECPTCRQSII